MAMILPDRIVEKIADPRERRRHVTAKNADKKATRRLEREEHKLLLGYLDRNEYAYAHSRTDVSATTNLGVPDFLIGCALGLAIEFKRHGNRLSPEQEEWRRRHIGRGGHYFVAHSYQEAKEIIETYNGKGI